MEKAQQPHSFEVKERSECAMTGIQKVVSSSATAISVTSVKGGMEISGKNLKIVKFDVEQGVLSFEGEIDGIKYSAPKVPLFKRLFK